MFASVLHVESERTISMLHSEGSDVRIVAFRVDSSVSSENSSRTDGDLRVLYEQHFVGDDCSVVSIIKEECNSVLRLGFVVRCMSTNKVCVFFHGRFGEKSASLRYVISNLVSV